MNSTVDVGNHFVIRFLQPSAFTDPVVDWDVRFLYTVPGSGSVELKEIKGSTISGHPLKDTGNRERLTLGLARS